MHLHYIACLNVYSIPCRCMYQSVYALVCRVCVGVKCTCKHANNNKEI